MLNKMQFPPLMIKNTEKMTLLIMDKEDIYTSNTVIIRLQVMEKDIADCKFVAQNWHTLKSYSILGNLGGGK